MKIFLILLSTILFCYSLYSLYEQNIQNFIHALVIAILANPKIIRTFNAHLLN